MRCGGNPVKIKGNVGDSSMVKSEDNRLKFAIELVPIMQSKDNAAFQAKINEYQSRFPADWETVAYWQAFLEKRLNNLDKAIELYSSTIDENISICSSSRMARGDTYFSLREFEKALHDYEACLLDTSPIAVERFHPSMRYRKALMLALLGREEFHLAIKAVPDDYSEYIYGRRRFPDDLRAIFEKNHAAGARGLV